MSNPFDVCDYYSAYSGVFSCYDLINAESGEIETSHRTLSQQDLQRILEACSEPRLRQGHISLSSPVEKSSSKIIDIEVPLSTTYLLSLAPSKTSEGPIKTEEQQLRQATMDLSAGDDKNNEAQYLFCLQKGKEDSVAHPGGMYWDQDRSMNTVVGIVILFLVIVVFAEAAEMILKMSVLSSLVIQIFLVQCD